MIFKNFKHLKEYRTNQSYLVPTNYGFVICLLSHLFGVLHLAANDLAVSRYFFLSLLYMFKGSCWAGLSMLGSSFKSF